MTHNTPTAAGATTLLIVDDSRVSRMMIRTLLQAKRPDWTLLEAVSGAEALAMAAAQPVDYCTMDINMPGMLGTEAAEQLLRDHTGLRLALFSANIQESQKSRAVELGVKFVAKPVSEKSIAEALAFFESTP
ncbi:response regulator transcription factor [Rhodoferax sp.]|uniref:response regulator transcription factor n=1 Tax=Rhodoferax sp. TaxID=50421 RepID=UPI00374DA81D